MEYVKCNLCGADRTVLWGVKDNINIVRCKKCGLVYCCPRPGNDDLQKYYSKAYFQDGHYDGDVLRQKMYAIEIDEIKKNIRPDGVFLDVGCAVGKFLSSLPDSYEKWGTEFSEEAAEIGRTKFGLNILTGQVRDIDLPQEYFDIVQMRGVLEHSQNPFEDLVSIRRILKKDGILRISQLPNISSLCALIFKTRFNQIKPSEHLYYFSPATVKGMLRKAGFKVKKMSYPYIGTPYESIMRDTINIIGNYLKNEESPPYFGNMMIAYAKKD